LRLICPGRPGIGLSDFQPGRRLLDWPEDIVALADTLNIDKFGVLGYSGGGPFAVACAFKIPDRLSNVALVGSVAPYETLGEKKEPKSMQEREAYWKFIAQLIEEDVDSFHAAYVANAAEADRALLAEQKSYFVAASREVFRQGVQGIVYEEEMLDAHVWGFPLEEITASVYLWHGEADENVPVKHGHYLAEHIPDCVATYLPGVGHVIPGQHFNDIFGIFADVTKSTLATDSF
jgi:pimeloyl-ACP methyl ester carboxylesterase